MAKTIAMILGAVLLAVGVAGFFISDLLGAHLSLAHNIVHLVTGAISLWFGTRATLAAARTWCILFGIVYGLLGVAGFLLGSGADKMWTVIPDQLMLGQMDHIIHVTFGVLFLVGGIATKVSAATPTAARA